MLWLSLVEKNVCLNSQKVELVLILKAMRETVWDLGPRRRALRESLELHHVQAGIGFCRVCQRVKGWAGLAAVTGAAACWT